MEFQWRWGFCCLTAHEKLLISTMTYRIVVFSITVKGLTFVRLAHRVCRAPELM
jgi:NhaP-type Na+/H+ or K+/H+ antiporter